MLEFISLLCYFPQFFPVYMWVDIWLKKKHVLHFAICTFLIQSDKGFLWKIPSDFYLEMLIFLISISNFHPAIKMSWRKEARFCGFKMDYLLARAFPAISGVTTQSNESIKVNFRKWLLIMGRKCLLGCGVENCALFWIFVGGICMNCPLDCTGVEEMECWVSSRLSISKNRSETNKQTKSHRFSRKPHNSAIFFREKFCAIVPNSSETHNFPKKTRKCSRI